MGGYAQVTFNNKWKLVHRAMNLPDTHKKGAIRLLSQIYEKYLLPFEPELSEQPLSSTKPDSTGRLAVGAIATARSNPFVSSVESMDDELVVDPLYLISLTLHRMEERIGSTQEAMLSKIDSLNKSVSYRLEGFKSLLNTVLSSQRQNHSVFSSKTQQIRKESDYRQDLVARGIGLLLSEMIPDS